VQEMFYHDNSQTLDHQPVWYYIKQCYDILSHKKVVKDESEVTTY